MSRLHPQVKPFRILKTAEGIESIPSLLGVCAALLSYALGVSAVYVAVAVFSAIAIGALLNTFGIYVVPGLVVVGTGFSYVAGYGVVFLVVVASGYIGGGIPGALAYVGGVLGGWIFEHLLDTVIGRRIFRSSGVAMTQSERSFINAYRLHAARLGKTIDVDLSPEEMEEEVWGPVLSEFCSEWPEVACRFEAS